MLEEIDIETQDAAKIWEQLAKNFAPVDRGFLRGEIRGDKTAFLNAEVVSPKFYSPYQEFGTGESRKIPPELVEYALQFKKGRKTKGIPPYRGIGYFFLHSDDVNEFWTKNINKILNTEH